MEASSLPPYATGRSMFYYLHLPVSAMFLLGLFCVRTRSKLHRSVIWMVLISNAFYVFIIACRSGWIPGL